MVTVRQYQCGGCGFKFQIAGSPFSGLCPQCRTSGKPALTYEAVVTDEEAQRWVTPKEPECDTPIFVEARGE